MIAFLYNNLLLQNRSTHRYGINTQEEDFNSGSYNSTEWNMDGATISITGSAPEHQLNVTTSNQSDAVEYIIPTEAGKEYTVQFTLANVEAADNLKVESRNINPSDPLTHNQLITYNSIASDGTYSIHFTAQKDEVRVRFLTDAVNAQASDYYPYGMRMKGRGISGKYAYGYQGSRSVDEVEGEGNTYTTEFRQLDSRLGIWRSPDPVFQPWQSPYNSMDGNPINLNDPFGDCATCKSDGLEKGDQTTSDDGIEWTFGGKSNDGKDIWYVQLDEVTINGGRNSKSPSDQKNEKTGADSNYGLGPGPWSQETLDKAAFEAVTGKSSESLDELDRKHQAYNEAGVNEIDPADDDDELYFFFISREVGGSLASSGGSGIQYMIYVYKDIDNLWTQYRTQTYLLWGIEGGYSYSNHLSEIKVGVSAGVGQITNVHPYDDINSLFESSKGRSFTLGKDGLEGGTAVLTSDGVQGKVDITMFFAKGGVSWGASKYKNRKISGGVQGGMFSKAARPPIRQYPSAKDTMRNILYNLKNEGMMPDSSIFKRWGK